MKRVIAASFLALLLCMGLAACDSNVNVPVVSSTPTTTTMPVVSSTPLFTDEITPSPSAMPGTGVPTASPAN